MIYQNDEDEREFAYTSPLLMIILKHLEFEVAKYSAELELVSFNEYGALVATTKSDFDLMGPCEIVERRFTRLDKNPSCHVTDFKKRLILVHATKPADLAYLL